jgi:predicted DNA-binding transcriptional regulator AlpA
MRPPFDNNLKEIADSMGIALYQRFTLNEASLFLRCPSSDLQNLVNKKEIQYIQVSQTEIQLFGYQLLQHLLNNVIGKPPQAPAKQSNDTQDRILRAHEVQQIVGVSRSTIWRMERKGQFPTRASILKRESMDSLCV